MKKVDDKITVAELSEIAQKMYGDLVKAVVDINKRDLVIDAEMHADIEQFFLEKGARQQDLWGINLYPAKFGTEEFIEFDSMINIRPRQKNMSRSVEDKGIRKEIIAIVDAKIEE
jgi:Protein of unknown function (DUF5674)